MYFQIYPIKVEVELEKFTNVETFWEDVKKRTKNIKSDRNIKIWQYYAEKRYEVLLNGKDRKGIKGI